LNYARKLPFGFFGFFQWHFRWFIRKPSDRPVNPFPVGRCSRTTPPPAHSGKKKRKRDWPNSMVFCHGPVVASGAADSQFLVFKLRMESASRMESITPKRAQNGLP